MTEGLPSTFYRLWNITIWLVAAGLVLSIDLVQTARNDASSAQLPGRRQRLMTLVRLLETEADQSGIAARGVKLITDLCDLSHPAGATPAEISRADVLRLMSPSGHQPREAVQRQSNGSRGEDMSIDESQHLPGQELDRFSLPMPGSTAWTSEGRWATPDGDFASVAFGMFGTGEGDQLLDLFVNLVPED